MNKNGLRVIPEGHFIFFGSPVETMPHDLFAANSHEFSRIDQKIRATSRKFVAEVLSFPLFTEEPLFVLTKLTILVKILINIVFLKKGMKNVGRKKHIRLDKQAVLQAAVDLVNAEGVAALTLSRLAQELGIRSPSLYNHVDGLPGLQKELSVMNARLIADRLSEAAIGKSGAELFMSTAQAFRNYVKEYPGLYMSSLRASGTQTAPDENLVREEERSLKVGLVVIASLGLQGDDGIHALRAFRSMVHGFATLEIAGGFGLPEDRDESFRRLVETLMTGLKRL